MIIERQEDVTRAVLAEMHRTPDARTKEILAAPVTHLHAFVRDVRLTEKEFQAAIGFVNAIGQKTTPSHNEAMLLSGTLGVSNLVCLLEPMPWVDVTSVAKAKRLIAAAGRSNAAILVDPIHFFRADNRFEDLAGLSFNYLQFCDAGAERPADNKELMRQAREDRMLPGEGGLDLAGLLRALPANLPISIELPLARKLDPQARARLVLEATLKFLAAGG